MKKILSFADLFRLALMIILLFFVIALNAQSVAINTNGNQADESSLLDISSTTKGILIPRMTSTQRGNITNPAEGLLVYDTDTKGFWFYTSNNWSELPKTSGGGGGNPTGPALGDLSGTYPSPNVVKIQNLDVAFGVPFNKQVMKWDMLNNRWQGQNDSLFLPYNVTHGSPDKLFGITNTNNTGGATAVYGKSGAGAGITPGSTVGVWGDNSSGLGVVGTSITGVGTYGLSFQNHGVSGYSTNNSFAGVFGSHANNGIGVMGEIQNAGTAVYGKSTGLAGRAGMFEISNTSATDTALWVKHSGLGAAGLFYNSSLSNNSYVIDAKNAGTGSGMNIMLGNINSTGTGINISNNGFGSGIVAATRVGRAAYFSNTFSGSISPVMELLNIGSAGSALITTNNSNNSNPSLDVSTNGTGSAVKGAVLNAANNSAAVFGNSSGLKGVEGIATSFGVYGQSSGVTGGVGVYGQSHQNSSNGIGVKAVSYATTMNAGALTAQNNNDGVAVHAVSSGGAGVNGIGVSGTGPSIGVFGNAIVPDGSAGYGLYGKLNGNNSFGAAAKFENYSNSSQSNTILAFDYSTGVPVKIFANNPANNSAAIYVNHTGTGKLLSLIGNNAIENFSVTNSGNTVSAGTMTVKGNKGIVRSTTNTQLRYETIPAVVEGVGGAAIVICGTCTYIRPITFPTPFSTPPAVALGNQNNGEATHLVHVSIRNVTTTGCELYIRNIYGSDLNFKTTWNLVAVGAE